MFPIHKSGQQKWNWDMGTDTTRPTSHSLHTLGGHLRSCVYIFWASFSRFSTIFWCVFFPGWQVWKHWDKGAMHIEPVKTLNPFKTPLLTRQRNISILSIWKGQCKDATGQDHQGRVSQSSLMGRHAMCCWYAAAHTLPRGPLQSTLIRCRNQVSRARAHIHAWVRHSPCHLPGLFAHPANSRIIGRSLMSTS